LRAGAGTGTRPYEVVDMIEILIDARGQECPKPLMMTKKALKEHGAFVVLIDRVNPKNNISRMLGDMGVPFEVAQDGECFRIKVTAG